MDMAFEDIRRAVAALEADIAGGPIVPAVLPGEIRDYLASRYDFTNAVALDDVIADVAGMMRRWHVQVTHPRYFGLFNPSVTLPSVIADTLTAMHNPQLASWRTSPAANEIERHTLAWLARRFGLPPSTIAHFTTGGAEANLSAVVVALARRFPQWGDGGLRSLPASPAIYLTSDTHDSFSKIARVTGLGSRALRVVSVDADRRMDMADLARRVDQDRRNGFAPLMAIGTAGTTAAGAIDPLADIAQFCQSEELWFHVDAAWGGAAVLSPRLRVHLDGITAADSITCDAHKWFSVPMGAGMFFCRHPAAVRDAFQAHAAYMPHAAAGATDDPYTTTLQWSRRFIGLKLFVALAQRGERGYVEMIEHQARMGDLLRDSLARAGWTIVNRTPLPLVCFTRSGLAVSRFLADMCERQIAWMSEVRLGDTPPVVRACVTSVRTREDDIDYVVREMTRLALRDSEVQV
jgi:glutamate/tyrosine decarboxylase-like PLP-dependent enzyme